MKSLISIPPEISGLARQKKAGVFKQNPKKVFLSLLAVSFLPTMFGAGAFGQDLTGDYEMIGRRCEDTKKMAPPDDATHEMFFGSGGSFRHTFFVINAPYAEEGGETIEEHQESRRQRKMERFLGYFEEDKQLHERTCRQHGRGAVIDEDGNDLCESRHKRDLYDRWRRERVEEAERELARDERDDERFIAENTKECFMELDGSYSTQGSRLTIFPGDFSASEGCGHDGAAYPPRLTMTYYFRGDRLYLVNKADRNSREYCGSSDWAEIYLRK